MIIYKITNLVNQKVYIGQTRQSLEKRWSAHKSQSNCMLISKSIKKHGSENFKIEQIDTAATLEELNKKEEYWISFYNSMNKVIGYNLTSGGDARILSEESRKKMSESRKGKKMTDKCRQALAKVHKNRKCTPEEKLRLLEINRNWYINQTEKRTISEDHQNKLTSAFLQTHIKIREYIKARGWTCNMPEAKRRLKVEVLTLLQKIQDAKE